MTASPQATTAVSRSVSAAPGNATSFSQNTSETADDAQVALAQEQCRAVLIKAQEIMELARGLEEASHGTASTEVAEAIAQAQSMRGLAEQARDVITFAPLDRMTGRKRIAPVMLASICQEMGRVLVDAGQEKGKLISETSEAKSTASKVWSDKSKPAKVVEKPKPKPKAKSEETLVVVPPVIVDEEAERRREMHVLRARGAMLTAGVVPAGLTSDTAAVVVVAAKPEQKAESATQKPLISRLLETPIAATQSAVETVQKKASTLVDSYVVTPAKSVAESAKSAAQSVGSVISNAAGSVYDYAGSQLKRAGDFASGLWPFGKKKSAPAPLERRVDAAPPATPAASADPAAERTGSMAQAMKQAAAAALPFMLQYQSVADALPIPSQVLPNLQHLQGIASYLGA